MEKTKIGVFGLGYVGLPLALEFAKVFPTIGYDISQQRVSEINSGVDRTLEVDSEVLQSTSSDSGFKAACNSDDLRECNIYIVTVPTPIDKNNRPDLTPLISASEIIGGILSRGDIVIYESTVYPGATEEDCVPILEAVSGLTFNQDFFCGYSPERINPGDKIHTITKIKKVTSGSTPATADRVDGLYKKIITAGTHKAPSLKVAEAAKVIENAQRDLNIALMNELAMIFNKMEIDTMDVLKAAGTKWNFLNFTPGLVGGHCIGVDPYYLTHKAQELGYHPDIILAGRRLNDGMAEFIASQIVKMMIKNTVIVNSSRALVMGVTFKENCPDIRNSKVLDVVRELQDFGINVDVTDPWANPEDVKRYFGKELLPMPVDMEFGVYDVLVYAVAHNEFTSISLPGINRPLIYDVKGLSDVCDARL